MALSLEIFEGKPNLEKRTLTFGPIDHLEETTPVGNPATVLLEFHAAAKESNDGGVSVVLFMF